MATDISRLKKGFVFKDFERFHCITKLKDGNNGETWRSGERNKNLGWMRAVQIQIKSLILAPFIKKKKKTFYFVFSQSRLTMLEQFQVNSGETQPQEMSRSKHFLCNHCFQNVISK